MFCNNCGKEIGENELFCRGCGHKTDVTVPETVQDETHNAQDTMQKAIKADSGLILIRKSTLVIYIVAMVIMVTQSILFMIFTRGSSYSSDSSLSSSTISKNVEKVNNREYRGGYYTGEWSDGKPNGHGVCTDGGQVSMECDWSDGVPTGVIEMVMGNTYYCKGYLNRTGNLEGEGYEKTTYDDGTIIINEGTFTDGVLTNGTNTLTKPDGTYYIAEGTFVNGDPYNATLSGAEAGGSFEEYGYYKNGKFSTNAGSALWNIGEEIADSYDGGKYSGIVHGIRDLWDAIK